MSALEIGASGAENTISGEISIFATWSEDIYFFDPDGSAMDISSITFYLQFRSDASQTNADVTLSTTSGTLSIVADSGGTDSILRISADSGTFSAYEGDMVCDLIADDGADNITHYGHGVVSFRNSPVAI